MGLSQSNPFLGMFSYNKGRNAKKTIIKEHLWEIKALADYQVVKCAMHPFSLSTSSTNAYNKWWKKYTDSIFLPRH